MAMDGFVQRLAIRADVDASLWLIFENTVACQIFCPTGVGYLQVYLLIYCSFQPCVASAIICEQRCLPSVSRL